MAKLIIEAEVDVIYIEEMQEIIEQIRGFGEIKEATLTVQAKTEINLAWKILGCWRDVEVYKKRVGKSQPIYGD